MPECTETGLESEARHPQTATPDAPSGRPPSVQFVSSLRYHHLRPAVREVLDLPRSTPACVLTRSNAEVERVHQSLSLLG